MLARPNEFYADPLSTDVFASWLGQRHNPRLVFLSACSSLSIATAYAMVSNGISSVIGYRWEIPDKYAPDLVRNFYDRLLGRPTVTIAEALRQAKTEFRDKHRNDPIWAAPMLLTRSRAELS